MEYTHLKTDRQHSQQKHVVMARSILSSGVASKQRGENASVRNGSDDISLFRRFMDGDDDAFMELFNRHTPRLFVYCLKIVGDRESANDILQDVWERLARFRAQNKEVPTSPLGLLIRTTRNLCLNFKRDRKPNIALQELPEWRTPRVYHNDLSEMEEAVVVALDHLPEHQRELLVLHSYSGYTYEEIAEMFGEGVGAIRTRAWRARLKLGRLIAAIMDIEDGSDEQDSRPTEAGGERKSNELTN